MRESVNQIYWYTKAWVHIQLVNSWSLIFRRLLSRQTKLTQKRALIIAPHQDDETLGCGGIIALKCQNHVPVSVVFLADGHGSHKRYANIESREIIQMRKEEAITALVTLGVDKSAIHFLDFPDGSLFELYRTNHRDAIEKLVEIFIETEPEEVYVTFHGDVHKDHEAAYQLTRIAIAHTNIQVKLFQYPIWSMWYPWRASYRVNDFFHIYRVPVHAVLEIKKQALLAYRSQYLPPSSHEVPSTPLSFFQLFCTSHEVFFVESVND